MALHATFAGKRVLVTGGGHGLGRKLVERLAVDNAIVVTLDKDSSALERVKKKFPDVYTVVVNLENWEETKTAVEGLGIFDHLVNNAAARNDASFLEISPQDFKTVFNVNVQAIIAVSQVVAKGMIESGRGGSIVNISSMASRTAIMSGGTVYSCSKASVNMLTKCMAVELAPFNIRVNCICPSFMETGLHSERMVRLKAQPASYLQSRALIKRYIKTDEAADFIFFLLSPLSAMITGSDFNMDGGFSTN